MKYIGLCLVVLLLVSGCSSDKSDVADETPTVKQTIENIPHDSDVTNEDLFNELDRLNGVDSIELDE